MGILLPSAARIASTQSSVQTRHRGSAAGVALYLDVTATPNDAQTLTVVLQAVEPVTGKAVTLGSFTALLASALGATPTTATFVYTAFPGAVETTAVANHEVQALPVLGPWRALVTHSAGGSWTYSLYASDA